jgi:N-acyl-D-amino-acid deacylase
MKRLLTFLVLVAPHCSQLQAADPGNGVESARRRGLARVKQAASDWQTHKSCFSCHHQTLPMLAALEGERVGFPLDKAWLKSQGDTTHRYFEERIEMLEEAERLPGGAATTGYGFWALMLDRRPADDTTTAMVNYLLQIQGVKRADERDPKKLPSLEDGRWIATCRRPPMQASMIADTVLVLMGMEKFATPEQRPRVTEARAKAEQWLAQAPLRDQQDRLWRLWGLHHLDGDGAQKAKVLTAIFAAQRDDGGWAEAKDGQSDTYSTGQTLFMLLKTGTAPDHPSIIRARDYLLKTQHADGSWHAVSHVTFKAQPYFENGDPYGVDQFLSTAATAWATAGLAQLLPPKPAAPAP